MASTLEKFYSAFGGLDTRSNKLQQDPKTFRKGSKNWRYNFQDELQGANGFQHRDAGNAEHSQALIPYNYVDISTGEAKMQLLGVDDDGILHRKRYHQLKASISVPDTFIPYSFFYDENEDSFVFTIEDQPINVSKSMTMAELVTAVNAVTTLITIDVFDDQGAAVVGSTQLAYLGIVAVNKDVWTDDFFHQSYYWERVITPTINEVCFPTTADFKDHPDYEGISYENLNNKIYMTDGGFPITYDGFAAYRTGMPRTAGSVNARTSSFDGFALTQGTVGYSALTVLSTYKYKYQLCFIDPNGQEILGKIQDPLTITLTGGNNVVTSAIPPIKNTDMFPVFGCRVDSQFILDNTNQTFNVDAGHNIQPGMVLRLPITNATLGFIGISYFYALVDSTTPTTITVAIPPNNSLRNPDNNSYTVVNDQWINAGYTTEANQNTVTEPVLQGGTWFLPPILAGAFLRIYRTLANQDTFYRLYEKEIPLDNGLVTPNDKYSWTDDWADSALSGFILSSDEGEELPRACKYLSSFQETLVQAGRPVDPSLKEDLYPTTYSLAGTVWGAPPDTEDFRFYNTEAMLCDHSSIYWADFQNSEGFPQSGLFEQLIKNKTNSKIKGMAPNKDSFFVFKEDQPALVTGDLIGQNIKVELLESNFGLISHRSLQEIGGAIIGLDGKKGFHACVAGRLPAPVGWPISDYMQINEEGLDYSKAVSANFANETLYFCAVGDHTFVFDYSESEVEKRSCWYLWDRIDTKNMCIYDGKLLLSDGETLWQMKTTNTKYDFTDDVDAIDFDVRTAWINMGLPTIDKDFTYFWINSIQGDFSLTVDQYGNYLADRVAELLNVNFLPEADKVAVKESVKANRDKLSAISFGMRNSTKNAFIRIQGYEIQMSGSYDKAEPKQ